MEEVLWKYVEQAYRGSRVPLGGRLLRDPLKVDLGGGWQDVWIHQVRWARTVRVSKFWGYVGLPVAFATIWALALAAMGAWMWAAALLAARMVMATAGGWGVLRCPDVLRMWILIPFRDLLTAAAWLVGLFGNTVTWRDRVLTIDREGRIRPG